MLLALLSLASAVGFDVDAVGLSALERAAIEERARTELSASVELVDARGLASCAVDDDVECARTILASAGVPAGAAVRVVKVLQVVRVELACLDTNGTVTARSSRTLDVDSAAKGPLFDASARDALAVLSPAPASDPPSGPLPSSDLSPSSSAGASSVSPLLVGAISGGVAGVALAIVGGVAAANEAALANSAASSGDEKERARTLGPIAVTVAVLGVIAAVGAPIAFVVLGE